MASLGSLPLANWTTTTKWWWSGSVAFFLFHVFCFLFFETNNILVLRTRCVSVLTCLWPSSWPVSCPQSVCTSSARRIAPWGAGPQLWARYLESWSPSCLRSSFLPPPQLLCWPQTSLQIPVQTEEWKNERLFRESVRTRLKSGVRDNNYLLTQT